MTVRRCSMLAATVGLWVAAPFWGHAQGPPVRPVVAQSPAEPARLGVADQDVPSVSANQRMADVIAEQLRASGHLRRFRIDISFQNGVAELTGQVADQAQREEALRIVVGVPGVSSVRDRLTLTAVAQLQRTQGKEPAPLPTEKQPVPAPVPPGGFQEPMPIFQAPGGAGQMQGQYQQAPPMPPYAWPTYAPYNNYSRVGYPTQLPANAFPFIGPQYPFPKVPLGWRSVHLTYYDGHWWYGKTATGHDYWRIRYW